MKILNFINYAEVSEYMLEKAKCGKNVTATLFLDEAIELMRNLMSYEEIEVGCIEIEQEEYNGYSKEYYVSLSNDMVLIVEQAWCKEGYLYAEPDIMLIDGDANSKILKGIPDDKCREIYVGESQQVVDEYCEDTKENLFTVLFDNAKLIKDSEDNPIGISFNVNDILNYLFK